MKKIFFLLSLFSLGNTFAASEEISFSHRHSLLGLSSGFSMPFVKSEEKRNYFYETTLGVSYRIPLFDHIDIDLDLLYGKVRWERWSEEIKRSDFVKTDLYLGYAFPDIKPGWRLVLRGGLYYNSFQFFELNNKRDMIKAPQLSPLWLYEQSDGSMFHMSFKYIHLDRGQLFSKEGEKEFGVGFKIGEIIPLNDQIGFLYNVELEALNITDSENKTRPVRNIVLSLGIGA